MVALQVAGYTLSKSVDLNISAEEAIQHSQRSSSSLLQLLAMIDTKEIKSNEILKDVYEECVTYKEYLSELLWSETETTEDISYTLDELNQAIHKYEMTNDMADGEWEFVDPAACCVSY